MATSSISLAAAAVGPSSHSLSATSVDHHLPRHFFPCKPKPISIIPSKIKICVHYSLFSPPTHSLVHCASTVFDNSVELNLDEEEGREEDGESGLEEEEEEAVSEQEIEEEEDSGTENSVEAGRLYVGNLPFSMTSSQLSEIFAEAGTVISVEIVYDRVTDRSRGFAFVTMGSVEEAKEAIRLFDGAQIGGRSAKVNFPEVPRGGEREVMSPKIRASYQGFVDSPHKLYAGNLSWGLTSQSLREAFADQPGFLSAKVIYDRDSGRSRGFGFVTFASAEEVESALNAMNGLELEGRPLRLNLAEQRGPALPSPAYQSASGNDSESSEMITSVGA